MIKKYHIKYEQPCNEHGSHYVEAVITCYDEGASIEMKNDVGAENSLALHDFFEHVMLFLAAIMDGPIQNGVYNEVSNEMH